MKRKQFLALLLSASMISSTVMPAYAADIEPDVSVTMEHTEETEEQEDEVPVEDVQDIPKVSDAEERTTETTETESPAEETEEVTETPESTPAAETENQPQAAMFSLERNVSYDVKLQNGADFATEFDNFVGHYKINDDGTVKMVYADIRLSDPEWSEYDHYEVTNITIPATVSNNSQSYTVKDIWLDCPFQYFQNEVETLTIAEGITSVSLGNMEPTKTLNLPSTMTIFERLSFPLKDGTPSAHADIKTETINFAGNDTLVYDKEHQRFYVRERGSGACENVGDQFSKINFKYEVVADGVVNIVDMFESEVDENVNVTVPSQVTFKNKTFKVQKVILDEYTKFKQCQKLRSLTFENGIEHAKLERCRGGIYIDGETKVESISIPATMNVEDLVGWPELKTITVDAANPYVSAEDDVLYNKDKTELRCFPANKEMDSFTIPASVKTLKEESFLSVKGLKNLYVPSTVETMENGAIVMTQGIKNIEVDSVENMYTNLASCHGAETITIKGIEELPQNFLAHNPDLKTINIEGDITYTGPYALTDNPSLEAYNVKDAKLISSVDGVLFNFDNLWSYPAGKKDAQYVIPETTSRVRATAFSSTTYLEKLICPKGVTFTTASVYYPKKALDIYLSDLDSIHIVEGNNDNIFLSKVGGHVYAPTQTVLDSINNHSNKDILNGYTATVGYIPADSFTVADSSITINKGKTKSLGVTTTPAYATEALQYQVSSDFCTVSADGVVTAKKAGAGTVTIKNAKGVTQTVQVKVTSSLQSLKFSSDSYTVNKNDIQKLDLIANPAGSDLTGLKLESDNENIVGISDNGEIIPRSAGTATITATCDGVQATCKVTVKVPLNSIDITDSSATIVIGGTKKLSVKYNPTDTTVGKKVEWSSNNQSVATVDSNGNVSAKGIGTATITAKVAGETDTCKITVTDKEIALQSIELSESNISLTEGGSKQLSVKYNPSNTTVNKTVAWSSSNNNVATVDKNGNIKAVGEGTATITAKVAGKADTCTVTVKKKEIALQSISIGGDFTLDCKDTKQLSVQYNPSNTTESGNASWSSSNEFIATVDGNGVVTGLRCGTSTITADVNGKTASVEVTVTVPDAELPFGDINPNDWFHKEVEEMYASGTMTGTQPDTFAPYDPVARAQFAVIIYRLLGSPDVEYNAKFPDVGDDIWYTDAITYASNFGIITGYSDTGKFGPADNINREQLAVMLFRLCNATGRDTSARGDLSQFADGGRVNSFAREAMEWAVGAGIITGKDGGTKCDPQGKASRAECAIMMSRFFKL